MLEVKHVKTKYGRRTFDYVGPRLWSALPVDVRIEENVDEFKKKVKTILFDAERRSSRPDPGSTLEWFMITAHVN